MNRVGLLDIQRAPSAVDDVALQPSLPHARQAAAAIARVWPQQPQAALILGTGLHKFARQIDIQTTLPYEDIPHFPRCTALGHVGRLVCGRLDGVPVLVMDGRWHRYEGYSPAEIMLPIFAMRALGVENLIASNASGGLNPRFASGDVVVIDDHINLMFWPRDVFLGTLRQGAGAIGCEDPGRHANYDAELNELAMQVARRANFAAHRGVYVAMSGPNYETRAEYRFLRKIGADVVGMSTVPEVIAAAACGMRSLALSIVTNVARPDCLQRTSGKLVEAAARRAEPHVRKIVIEAVRWIGAKFQHPADANRRRPR